MYFWRDRGFLQIITCISLCLTEEAATGEITGIPTTYMGKLKNHTFWGVAIPDDEKTQPFARYVASVDDPDGWTFVYEEAGSDKELLESYPRLNNGNLVEVLGTQKGSDGAVWNMISIAGAYAGYVRADHLRRK